MVKLVTFWKIRKICKKSGIRYEMWQTWPIPIYCQMMERVWEHCWNWWRRARREEKEAEETTCEEVDLLVKWENYWVNLFLKVKITSSLIFFINKQLHSDFVFIFIINEFLNASTFLPQLQYFLHKTLFICFLPNVRNSFYISFLFFIFL